MRWRTYFVPCVALGLIVLGIMPWGTTAKQSTPNKENALAGQDGKESVRLTGHMLVGSKRICTFRFSAEFFWQRSKTIAVGEVAEFRAEDKEVATWPGVPGKMAVIKVVKEFTDSKAKEVQVATRFLELYSWEAPYTGPKEPIYKLARGECLLICRGIYTDAAIKLPGNWEQTSLVRSLERIAAVRNSPKKGPGLQAGGLGEDDRTACYCLYRLLADPTLAG